MIYIAIQEGRPRAAAVHNPPPFAAEFGAPGVRGLVRDRGPFTVEAYINAASAHAALTDGLTKAELVEVGADLGLSLNAQSLKAELLADIRAHLEGLDNG